MGDWDFMVGKTIAGIEEDTYGDVWVEFTDGTGAELRPDGYEAEGVSPAELSAEGLEQRREAKREREREKAERQRVAAEQRAEEERMREELDPVAFGVWMDEHRPGWRLRSIMSDLYRVALEDMMRSQRRMLYDGDARGGYSVKAD